MPLTGRLTGNPLPFAEGPARDCTHADMPVHRMCCYINNGGCPFQALSETLLRNSLRADLGILDKASKAVHKVGPIEGVAANAHHCALPQTLLCRLVDGLQQRAACSGTSPVCFVLSAQHIRQFVTRDSQLPAASSGLTQRRTVSLMDCLQQTSGCSNPWQCLECCLLSVLTGWTTVACSHQQSASNISRHCTHH